MSQHRYLVKDNNDLVSYCECETALITFPPQMDCPWCGCGWLFTCMECRQAFSFARCVEIDTPWEELARTDVAHLLAEPATDDDLQQWVEAMQELHAELEVGQQYVCMDGLFIPTAAGGVAFEGWHAAHDLDFIPHIEALDDPEVIDGILANEEYWQSRAIVEDD